MQVSARGSKIVQDSAKVFYWDEYTLKSDFLYHFQVNIYWYQCLVAGMREWVTYNDCE